MMLRVGIVSIYPPKDVRHAHLGGVASYTKNLAVNIATAKQFQPLIFANELPYSQSYFEDNIEVVRCWRSYPLYPFQVWLSALKRRKSLDIFHVQHEYFLYGGSSSAILFPLMLFLLYTLRKPIILTFHGVISPNSVDTSFTRSNNMSGNVTLLKFGLIAITKFSLLLANKIVVHEDFFKKSLCNTYHCPEGKVLVIPHGVEGIKSSIDNVDAKRLLRVSQKRVLLFFGFLTGYKGLDYLVREFSKLEMSEYVLFVCGGKHPRLNADSSNELEQLIRQSTQGRDNIVWTGFVPEDEIGLYFSAADLVLLPYTIAMASSGPMNLALAFQKPFLVSHFFEEIVGRANIFHLEKPNDLSIKVEEFFSNVDSQQLAMKYVKRYSRANSWENVAQKTMALYEELL